MQSSRPARIPLQSTPLPNPRVTVTARQKANRTTGGNIPPTERNRGGSRRDFNSTSECGARVERLAIAATHPGWTVRCVSKLLRYAPQVVAGNGQFNGVRKLARM